MPPVATLMVGVGETEAGCCMGRGYMGSSYKEERKVDRGWGTPLAEKEGVLT